MTLSKTIVCPVGDQPDALFPALREFTVDHVHMLVPKKYHRQAKRLKKDLDKWGIKYSEQPIGDNLWEDTFTRVAEFAKHHPRPQDILVHVGVGDRHSQCAATSAAFVNGLRGLNGTKDMVMGLPILKFSYYTQLQERKMKILEALATGSQSLNDLGKELKMSLSLLSYHVHGNRKSEGLVTMGLVELDERGNQTFLTLTAMGRLILKGLMPECEVC